MFFPRSGSFGPRITSSEITGESTYQEFQHDRRRFLASSLATGGLLASAAISRLLKPVEVQADEQLVTKPSQYTLPDNETPIIKATHYNNFYEFGVNKDDPAKNAHTLHTRPWTIQVTGLVKKPQTFDIDTLMKYRPIESRVYRHRCVEAWSMVIPWDGYSLSEFINLCEPLSNAKYVQFLSLVDKKQMPNLPYGYNWPYSEGLRLDEALNPLALLTFGCYGQTLPNQNGAPIRVISPWKYGFKNGKSIVRFHFTDKQPHTTWNEQNSDEYGFYSNVNPTVNHPRWSQAHERRIDSSAFPRTVPTMMFNGYADQVGSLYSGMDLRRYY
jgi:sulfoxide reductase catalytic subunit YedY